MVQPQATVLGHAGGQSCKRHVKSLIHEVGSRPQLEDKPKGDVPGEPD